MSKNKVKNNNKGFTIIEVLIVLAIAALILLVVFLAVPNLQRSQRNNGRQSEAARLSTAVTTMIGNDQGTLPGFQIGGTTYNSTQADNDGAGLVANFGTFKYLKISSGTGAAVPTASTALTAGTLTIYVPPNLIISPSSGASTYTAPSGGGDAIAIVDNAKCGSSGATMTLTGGTAGQSVATIYTTETASGAYNLACIQTQD